MKKTAYLILVCLMLLSLFAGCGKDNSDSSAPIASQPDVQQPQEDNATEEQESLDLRDVYNAIIAKQAETGKDEIILFEEANPDYLAGFYPGIDQYEMVQSLYYLPPIYGHACEIVLLEPANKGDMNAIKDILQARIDTASDDSTYPENAKPWAEFAQIQQQGNYICLIVLPEGYIIPDNVFDLN